MSTEQNYDNEGESLTLPSEQEPKQRQGAIPPAHEWHFMDIPFDDSYRLHLLIVASEDLNEFRLMLRGWFMAYLHDTTNDPAGENAIQHNSVLENALFFEALDDFFVQLCYAPREKPESK